METPEGYTLTARTAAEGARRVLMGEFKPGFQTPAMAFGENFILDFEGVEFPVAWFAEGLRIVNVANPHHPTEVGYFVPPVPEGQERVQSNDVCLDDRGLIYLVDRYRGLHILERE